MHKYLFVLAVVVGLTGCDGNHPASTDNLSEAVKWSKEFPELAPDLQTKLEDNNLTKDEFRLLYEEYRKMERSKVVASARAELEQLSEVDLENKMAQLAAKRDKLKKAKAIQVSTEVAGIPLTEVDDKKVEVIEIK